MQTSLARIEDFHSETLECKDLTVNMHEGRPVRGYLCMPKDALPQSLPIVIYAHSAGVNKVFNYATTKRAADLTEKGPEISQYAQNARHYVEKVYSWENIGRQYQTAYEAILEKGRK